MPPAMNTPKRLAVRLMLATGSTFAAIIGAQSLAMQQTPQTNTDSIAPPPPATALPLAPTPVPTAGSVTISRAAPSITILRMPGQTLSQASAPDRSAPPAQVENAAAQQRQIVPPNPVTLAEPAPMVVQSDPIYVQPPPVVQVVQGSNSDDDNDGGGSSGGSSSGSHSMPKSSSSK